MPCSFNLPSNSFQFLHLGRHSLIASYISYRVRSGSRSRSRRTASLPGARCSPKRSVSSRQTFALRSLMLRSEMVCP